MFFCGSQTVILFRHGVAYRGPPAEKAPAHPVSEVSDDEISDQRRGRVSLFPDVDDGLAEMVLVTKPGGKVLVVAFGGFQKAEFLGFFIAAVMAAVPSFTVPPTNSPPLPFQLADPDVFRGRLTGAGLTDVTVETWDMHFRSGTHTWTVVTSQQPDRGTAGRGPDRRPARRRGIRARRDPSGTLGRPTGRGAVRRRQRRHRYEVTPRFRHSCPFSVGGGRTFDPPLPCAHGATAQIC